MMKVLMISVFLSIGRILYGQEMSKKVNLNFIWQFCTDYFASFTRNVTNNFLSWFSPELKQNIIKKKIVHVEIK